MGIMLTYSQLAEIIIDSSKTSKEGIIREIEPKVEEVLFTPKPIKVITGIRRSGKSFLLKRQYKKLLHNAIPQQNILFVNFEDDRLTDNLDLKGLRRIYELFISKAELEKPIYLFLDEIQNIDGWEKFVRTLYDSTNHAIYITGSNAQLLSKEFASTLGGRLLEFSVLPFSFRETLAYFEIAIENKFEQASNASQIRNVMSNYLNFGGIAETFDLSDDAKKTYRKSLIDKIVINDIIERYKLNSPELLDNILLYLEKNIGNIVSYANIANVSKSTDNTIEKYISYLINAFILKKLPKFSWKTKSIFDKNKKFYFIDNLFSLNADIEDKLENLCYQHLIRTFPDDKLFLGRDDKGKEIDFLVKHSDDSFTAVQVCYELNQRNMKRESSSLLLFNKYDDNPNNQYLIVYMYNTLTSEIPQGVKGVHLLDFLLD